MGYTHYWSFKKAPRGKAKRIEDIYVHALKECTVVANAYSKEFGGLAGFSAHCAPGEYGGLNLNGSRENGHEDFSMREHYRDAVKERFSFCKTAQKPYDLMVVACLAVLKHHLGVLIEVSSDGRYSDLEPGTRYASKILGYDIANPAPYEGLRLLAK